MPGTSGSVSYSPSGLGLSLMHDPEFYVMFCSQVKLYSDSPKEYGREKLLRVWDAIPSLPRFNELHVDEFALKAPTIRRRKARQVVEELEGDIFAEWDYNPSIIRGLGDHGDWDGAEQGGNDAFHS